MMESQILSLILMFILLGLAFDGDVEMGNAGTGTAAAASLGVLPSVVVERMDSTRLVGRAWDTYHIGHAESCHFHFHPLNHHLTVNVCD